MFRLGTSNAVNLIFIHKLQFLLLYIIIIFFNNYIVRMFMWFDVNFRER